MTDSTNIANFANYFLVVLIAALTILTAVLIYYAQRRDLRRIFKASEQRERINPFAAYHSLEIDELARDLLVDADFPYQERRPQHLRSRLSKELILENVLLVGRRGLGKTREALEIISRKCDYFGEETTILYIKGDLLDTPLRSEWVKGKKFCILFFDDVDKFMLQSGFDEMDSPIERLGRVIDWLSNHFDRLNCVFTSRDENWSEIKRALGWPWGFWHTHRFRKYQITGIHKSQRAGFIRAAAGYFDLDVSESEVNLIKSRWDGTGEAILSAFRRFRNIRDKKTLISDLRFTYPGTWHQDVYQKLISGDSGKRQVFEALAALNFYRIPQYQFLVLDIAACSGRGFFGVFFRSRMQRAVDDLISWMFPHNGIIICPKAYVETIQLPQGTSENLLAGLKRSWKDPKQAELLWPHIHRIVHMSNAGLVEKDTAIRFYESLRRHDFGTGLDLLLARLLNSVRRHQEALQLVHYGKFDPRDSDQGTAIFAARLLEEVGLGASSIDLLERIHSAWPDSERATIAYGIALSRRGLLDKAAVILRKAALLYPSSSYLQETLGRVLEDSGKNEEAVQCLLLATKIDPYSSTANHTLAIFLEKQGRFEEAAIHFRRANKNRPGQPRILMGIAAALFNSHKDDEARVWSHKVRTMIGDDRALLRNYAEILGFSNSQEGKKLGCEIYAEVAEEANSVSDWVALSHAHRSLQQNTDAVDAARKALELDPDSLDAKRSLATNLRFSEKPGAKDEAVSILSQIAEGSKDAADWVAFSRACTSVLDNPGGEKAARRALEFDPDSLDAKRALAFNLRFLEKPGAKDEAVSILCQIAEGSDDATDWVALSDAHGSLQQNADAVDAARKALEFDPDSLDAKRSLAFNLCHLGKLETLNESLKLLNEIPEEEKTAEDFSLQAYCHHLSGNENKSFEYIITSISKNITKTALERFSIFSNRLSTREAAHRRVMLLDVIGTEESGIWKILEEDSIDPIVWKIAAWYFLDRGDKAKFFQFLEYKLDADKGTLDAIVSSVEEISNLHPEFSLNVMSSVVDRVKTQRYMNFFGSLQRKNGLLTEAKETYLRSIEFDHKNGPAWYGLGKTYLDMGEKDEARHAFENAPNHRRSIDCLKELSN